MSRTILIFALIAAGASVASGCDPGGAKSATVGTANGLVDDVSSSAEGESKEPVDIPQPLFSLAWQGVTSGASSVAGGLEMEIVNISERERSFSVTFLFTGLFDKMAQLEMAGMSLAPGGSTTVSIPAGDIPLQTRTGACQVHALVRPYNPATSETEGEIQGLAPVLYRHSEAYDSVQLFDEQYLVGSLGGTLFGDAAFSSPESLASAEIGRIKNADGEFDTLLMANSPLVHMEGGQVIDAIVESGVEYAVHGDEVPSEVPHVE